MEIVPPKLLTTRNLNLFKELQEYFQMQFEFLSDSETNTTIDFIAFDNYVDYPLPVSKQIFNTFSSLKFNLSKSDFLIGMSTIYNGTFDERLRFLIELFDFDQDGIIHLEDIEFLIIHFHSSSNEKPFDSIINHIRGIVKKQSLFTKEEMKEIIKANADIYYYFYINFHLRKPYEDSSIAFNTQIKRNSDKTASGNVVKISSSSSLIIDKKEFNDEGIINYQPSDYLQNYFSELNEENDLDLNELTAFEEDLRLIKNTSHLKRANRPFHGFKLRNSLFDSQAMLQRKKTSLSKNNNSIVSLFNQSNDNNDDNSFEHMNCYIQNIDSTNYSKVNVYIIGQDLYITDNKSIAFVSLKQIYIKTTLNNSIHKREITLEDNNTKALVYSITMISNYPLKAQLYTLCFDTEEEANMFQELIVFATHYSNPHDHYEQLEIINQGSFGIVYKVKDRHTNQIYAQKVIPKPTDFNYEMLLSLKYESYISRLFIDISHPGIATFYDIFEDETSVYIIQQYYSQGNLQDYFNSFNQQLPTVLVMEKMKELVSSLQFLYKYGIIHRDLKMDNILMENKKTIIIDFGLSTILSQFETTIQRCGTLGYFAPELIKREPYNHSVDTWSLGVIGYYLYYGKFHYDINHFRKSSSDIIYSVINEEYTFPIRQEDNEDNTFISFLLMKCLEKDYKQRINITDIKF